MGEKVKIWNSQRKWGESEGAGKERHTERETRSTYATFQTTNTVMIMITTKKTKASTTPTAT